MPILKEYFTVYAGEDRSLALRVVNTQLTPFSLVGVLEIEARFKKADGGVLTRKLSPIKEITKYTISQMGSFFDVVGSAKAVQMYDSPAIGHYFWFNVTDGPNTQIDPILIGTAHQVDILMTDSPFVIATKLYTQVALVSAAFTATNTINGEVQVTNVTGGDSTNASATGSSATVTVLTPGLAPGITITNDVLGKLTVLMRAADSSLLLIGDRQTFSLVITTASSVRKVNYRNALSVERQVV